jgi:hypothetical protein
VSEDADYSELYQTCMEKLKWNPEVVNNLTFAQLAAYGGKAAGKIVAPNGLFEEIAPAIQEWLEREKPENALREAEDMLEEYLIRGY